MSRGKLNRDVIARAALELADAEGGMKGVTMRKVAAHLEVGTMSLYHYVKDRGDLISALGNELMGELLIDTVPTQWRPGLRAIALSSKRVFERHPWMLRAMYDEDGNDIGVNGMKHFEQSLTPLAGLELERKDRLHLISIVDEYSFGALLARQAPDNEREAVAEAAEAIGSMLDAETYPHTHALMRAGEDPRATTQAVFAEMMADDRFETGLEILLDGIEVFLRRKGAIA